MPLVPRFGISHMPVSREFAREWQFNGLATSRPSDFAEQDFWKTDPLIDCRPGLPTTWRFLGGDQPKSCLRSALLVLRYEFLAFSWPVFSSTPTLSSIAACTAAPSHDRDGIPGGIRPLVAISVSA